jgi:polysaccharide deacetylase family protein (PEP-CTERM system associated)
MPCNPRESTHETVHAFTVDVEGFAESHQQSVAVDPALLEPSAMDREIEENLSATLDILCEHGITATFFFLGRIAQTAPRLVRRVADAGHEIGCHSLYHRRITGQSEGDFRAQLTEAKERLEDASGKEVIGFRAPDFSITNENRWALDALADAGFRYDSSIVPTGLHDVYGMQNVPEEVFRWQNGLIEFPLPVVHLLGVSFPVGGGGYFRLYPLAVTTRFYRRQTLKGRATVFYIHPYEIGSVAPRLTGLSRTRRFRHYVRLSKGAKRLPQLFQAASFESMAGVLAAMGFLNAGN